MKEVVRGVYIPLHSDSVDLTIRTDSVIGSEEEVYAYFIDDDNQIAGSVLIQLSSPIRYLLGWCTGWISFPVTPPTQTEKTWRIAYNPAELRVVIHCNEVEVVNVVLPDGVCTVNRGWRTYWEQRKPTQITFIDKDNASDEYCLAGGVGMFILISILRYIS